MDLDIAKSAGFCFGVKRAIDLINVSIENKNNKIYTLGPIIHNKHVVDDLELKGVKALSSIDEINDNDKTTKLVIRTHGISKSIYDKLDQKNISFLDATCPYVKKIHNIVEKYYNENYAIIIIGNKDHPEVIGINGWCNNSAIIIENLKYCKKNIEKIKKCDKICIVAQTTYKKIEWNKIIDYLKENFENTLIFDTICNATNQRQLESVEISKNVDVMFVIGGKNSSNTCKLFEECNKYCKNTYHIEHFSDIDNSLNFNDKSIGITAGASTPMWIIDEVINKLVYNN